MSRTHDALLPSPDIGPPLQKVFHNEHVGDNPLIVPKRQAADRGKQGASESVFVSQKSGDSRWAITVGVRMRTRGGRPRSRPGIWSLGCKIQTSAVGNRSDTVVFLRIMTSRRACDVALPRVFSTEGNVVICAGIVAHNCKARGIAEGRSRKSKLFRVGGEGQSGAVRYWVKMESRCCEVRGNSARARVAHAYTAYCRSGWWR